jgi:adenylate cyclase
MKKKTYLKSFYFFFALGLMALVIPFTLYLEFNKGSYSAGFLGDTARLFQRMENLITDSKFRLRENKTGNEKVIVVAIDEESLEKLGRWQSWGRDFYAQTIAKLDEYGAKVIGFDVVFDSPDENKGFQYLKQLTEQYPSFHLKKNNDYLTALQNATQFSNTDWMLIEAARTFNSDRQKAVVYGYFVETHPGEFVEQKMKDMPKDLKILMRSLIPFKRPSGAPIPLDLMKKVDEYGINFDELAKSSNYHGYFSMNPDVDGVVREYRLLMSMYGQVYPSLAFKMLERYWQDNALLKMLDDGQLYIELNKKDFVLPVTDKGTIKLNYYGPQNSFITVSMADLLNDESQVKYRYNHSQNADYIKEKHELFKDSIVLIGATAIGIFDVRNTPKQVNLPGVEVHATVLSQFLDNNFFIENDQAHVMQVLILTGLLLLFLSFSIYKFGAVETMIFNFVLLSAIFIYDYNFYFLNNYLVKLTPLYCSLFFSYLILNAYKFLTEEKEKNRIKDTFKQYVSADVVQKMIEDPAAIKMGGESKYLTVLFSDIEGFTTISEKLSPEELSQLLNIYLTGMTEVVFENKGTLDKFIGDAIMCFWGAPVSMEDHVTKACVTALEMQKVNEKLNIRFEKEYGLTINTRIGINSGDMAVGNMGSETQFAYTVLGDSVNLAARLEGINKEYATQIMISEFSFEQVKDKFVFRKIDKVAVKGKEEPVTIYQLLGAFDEVSEEEVKVVHKFHEGLNYYFNKKFSDALEVFHSEELKQDETSRMFASRCKEFLSTPPSAEWNGVWVMKTK